MQYAVMTQVHKPHEAVHIKVVFGCRHNADVLPGLGCTIDFRHGASVGAYVNKDMQGRLLH